MNSSPEPRKKRHRPLHRAVLGTVATALAGAGVLAPAPAAAATSASFEATANTTVPNTPPETPYGRGTSPATACTGGAVGNTRTALYAWVDDVDSADLTARFQVFGSEGTSPVAEVPVSATRGTSATALVDLPTGSYHWRVRAEDSAGAVSAWTDSCVFSVDRVRPDKPPVVSSEEFPDGDNGWPENTGNARTPGTFTLGPNGVDDVVTYVWYTDSEPQLRQVSVSAGSGAAITYTPLNKGLNRLYAYSIDAAGNRSDTMTYRFYANGATAPDAPGDLNGDGNKDIWSLDPDGNLLTYAGRGDGSFSPPTSGGQTLADASIAYRGDWGQDGYVDLVTLEYSPAQQRKELWVYSNSGLGVASTTANVGKQPVTVKCPFPDEDSGCFGSGNDHWHDADAIVAPGDVNGDDKHDLLVQEGSRLWVYYGVGSTRLGVPVLVEGIDWDDYTVLAPGDIDGDGLADLWLRDKATGDVLGVRGGAGADGQLDPATWGDPANRVTIARGFTTAAHPDLGTVGDFDGDAVADLWGRAPDGTMTLWSGRVADDQSFGFAEGRPIG
ncbi:VCBS repeat-containing protein [Streptomyces sp. NPDC052164]|uniref:VCBS repeat-containing protein n=1 Tax=Streptomyces sp. NPDC052164 TaxID=3155529 RepID=UPI00342754CF